jgi:hypothetical protein
MLSSFLELTLLPRENLCSCGIWDGNTNALLVVIPDQDSLEPRGQFAIGHNIVMHGQALTSDSRDARRDAHLVLHQHGLDVIGFDSSQHQRGLGGIGQFEVRKISQPRHFDVGQVDGIVDVPERVQIAETHSHRNKKRVLHRG